jgi:hypothetical protein
MQAIAALVPKPPLPMPRPPSRPPASAAPGRAGPTSLADVARLAGVSPVPCRAC